MSFSCPECGTTLMVKTELPGKKVKCPRCGALVSGPLVRPAGPSKARGLGAKGWLLASLGLAATSLALVLFGVWLLRATRSLPRGAGVQQAEPERPAEQERSKTKDEEGSSVVQPLPRESSQTYHEPFKGLPKKPQDFGLYGTDAAQYVKFEANGLSMRFPPGKKCEPAGVTTRFGVRGDFEITVRYELLHEPQPAGDVLQSNITLIVHLDKPTLFEANLSRKVMPQGTGYITSTIMRPENAKPFSQARSYPANGNTGQLRLVRTGSEVAYSIAEGAGDFTPLQKTSLGTEDLKYVRLIAWMKADAKPALDVRFTDLRIRAQALVNRL